MLYIILALIGTAGVFWSVAHPPTEPVYHCKSPSGEITHSFDPCPQDSIQFNPGDEPK